MLQFEEVGEEDFGLSRNMQRMCHLSCGASSRPSADNRDDEGLPATTPVTSSDVTDLGIAATQVVRTQSAATMTQGRGQQDAGEENRQMPARWRGVRMPGEATPASQIIDVPGSLPATVPDSPGCSSQPRTDLGLEQPDVRSPNARSTTFASSPRSRTSTRRTRFRRTPEIFASALLDHKAC